ncbi:hypothetical protein V8C43DRAFT_319532 [Trichoderma afarasin]
MTFRQGISYCGGCLLRLLAAIVTTRGVLALLVFHHGSSSSITCAMVRVGRRDLMITHGALSHQGWPTENASPKHTTVRAVSDSGSRFVFSLHTPARLRVHCRRKDERKQMRSGLNSSHEAMDCRCFTCVKTCTLIQCGMSFVLWHQNLLQDAENLVLSPP